MSVVCIEAVSKEKYKCIKGQRVNLTYYPDTETVAGIEMEVMTVVRIKIA